MKDFDQSKLDKTKHIEFLRQGGSDWIVEFKELKELKIKDQELD